MKERLSEAAFEGIDGVHDLDVTLEMYADAAAESIIAVLPECIKPLTVHTYKDGGRAESEDGIFKYEWYETQPSKFNVLDARMGKRIATGVDDPQAAYIEHHRNQVMSAFVSELST